LKHREKAVPLFSQMSFLFSNSNEVEVTQYVKVTPSHFAESQNVAKAPTYALPLTCELWK
jgi:hypothetical protein